MRSSQPTLDLLIDLCARLRLATEAIGDRCEVRPRDVRLEHVSEMEQDRLRDLGRQDLWSLINESNAPLSVAAPARERSQ